MQAIERQRSKVLLDPPDVAAEWGTTVNRLAQWRCSGKGPRWVKIGGRVKYFRAELDAWIEKNTHNRTSERTAA